MWRDTRVALILFLRNFVMADSNSENLVRLEGIEPPALRSGESRHPTPELDLPNSVEYANVS